MTMELNDISMMAHALLALEREIDTDEKALSEKKARALMIREEDIPMAMQELELTSFKLSSGETVTVSQEVYASIPVANREAAYKWLEDHDYDGVIKTSIEAEFQKGEMERAIKILDLLAEHGVEAALSKNIHAQTLKALLKEILAKGEEFPLDTFGARPVWTAKIKGAKK